VIECVANVSEGASRELIARLASAVSHSGCRLLDVHSDVDHNRSVFTFVGRAAILEKGAVALAAAAVDLLDLAVHRGVHPRSGVIDVVPFVPLANATMDECVHLARRVGRTIGERLALPVYLYGAAAARPERTSLADVRRGPLKQLGERMRTPEGKPDFGPDEPHPTAGAVAVGARELLVAYNVVLDSGDVSVARAVAASVRESGGGLKGVRALGFLLPSRHLVQVSMNLTDVYATSVRTAFEFVEREAAQRGISVCESEIVGLAPQVALDGCRGTDIQFPGDLDSVRLERRIR